MTFTFEPYGVCIGAETEEEAAHLDEANERTGGDIMRVVLVLANQYGYDMRPVLAHLGCLASIGVRWKAGVDITPPGVLPTDLRPC